MLDIAYIRENPDQIRHLVEVKKVSLSVDELLELDAKRRSLLGTIEELRAKRNHISGQMKQMVTLTPEQKQVLIEEGKQVKQDLTQHEEEFEFLDTRYWELMYAVPNVYSEDTPVGLSEDHNVVIRTIGQKPEFTFTPKEHWELGEALGLIDTKTSATVAGSRFAYLKGSLVRMQFGIIQLVMEILSNSKTLEKIAHEAGLQIDPKPFIPIVPPVMMKPEVMKRMGRLDPIDERYQTTEDGLMLVGSAEHTLGPLHMEEIIPIDQLPIRYVGYSTAFRREAGTYGKDMKGILRLHQFDKLEIETFTTREQGLLEQDFILAIQEYLMSLLKLPYQVVLKCTADMGTPDVRAFDIETWLPGQGKYRETHTSDYMGDYQARRLNTRYETKDRTKEFVHMNDATVFAIGRILIAIMENYQQPDGSIRVPEVLVPYVGASLITR